MKKLLSVLTIICLLTGMMAVSASAEEANTSITSVLYTSAGNRFDLLIKGAAGKNAYVSIIVKNESGEVRAMEQCTSDETGFFSKQVFADTSDDSALRNEDGAFLYTVYVRDYNNSSASETVWLYSEDMKQKIIDENFKTAADYGEMKAAIEKYGKVFGFNTTYYTSMAEEAAEYMLAGKEGLKTDTIVDAFNEAIVRAYLFNTDFNADRTQILEDADLSAVTDFVNGFGGAASLYPEYKSMTAEQKKSVNSAVFDAKNKKSEFVKLKEMFFMAITAQVFADNKSDYTAVYNFLKSHNDWFNLEGFEDLTKYKASQIIGLLSAKTIPNTRAAFSALYDECLAEINGDSKPVTPPSGGGTGGSGSSGGGSQISSGIKLPASDNTSVINNGGEYFDDLDGYGWAGEAVKALFDKKIIAGKGNNKFAPGDSITREEFAKILSLAYGLYDESAECGFSDVSETDWSYKYIASIYKSGITNGYADGSFGARSNISREEMAVMIYRVLLQQSKIKSPESIESKFKDFNDVSDFAVNSVLALSNDRIISGDGNGNFNPKSHASRAETCVMIYNAALIKGE